jgi:hypothetical protein
MKIGDFNRKKRYWDAYWQKEVLDRPLINVTSPKKGVEFRGFPYNDHISATACLTKDYKNYFGAFKASMDTTYYGGESIPFVNVTLGPDQYAAFLGASIKTQEGFITTWVEGHVDDWTNFEVNIDRSENSYFQRIQECIEYGTRFADGEFLIAMLDLHSNMDALSALRGPQNLCLDLMDCPEEVHRVLNAVRKTYPEVHEMVHRTGKMDKYGSIGWSPTYCPSGRFAVIQCDFSCMMSPAQVREFVIPAIREEAAYLDRCVYHYDGKDALGHIDDILSIQEIDVIQWVPGDGQPRSIEWMDLLTKIQKAGKGLWIYDWTADEIETRFKELSPEGLLFSIHVDSQDEADRLLENVKSNM